MANAFYTLGIEAILKGTISWNSDTIKVSLVTSGYTPTLATDQYYNIIPGGDVISTPVALSSKTTAGGRAGAANTTFSSVSSGSTVTYLAIYKDTGTSSTSPLICLLDTANGLPFATNGGDIVIVWDSGANGIFLLTPWWIAAVTFLAGLHSILGKLGFAAGAFFCGLRRRFWPTAGETITLALPLPRLTLG